MRLSSALRARCNRSNPAPPAKRSAAPSGAKRSSQGIRRGRGWALISIAVLLWIVLRRLTDVLVTLIPLMVAAIVTLEICALTRFQLNYANIIALPVLLGIGVAFKIYYVTGVAKGTDQFPAIGADARGVLQHTTDRDRVRQPVALQPARHIQHGQAPGAVACLHACRGGAVPAGLDGRSAPLCAA